MLENGSVRLQVAMMAGDDGGKRMAVVRLGRLSNL